MEILIIGVVNKFVVIMETILNKESRAAIELMVADGIIDKDTAERYFPELRGSEDERIRKWIRKELESKYVVDNIVNNVMADKALAWLENHEQKPDGWSEEDRINLQRAVYYVDFYQTHEADTQDSAECMNWLKSLKDRIQPRPQQKWSEEDKKMRIKVLKYISTRCNVFEYEEVECWFKSLEDRVQSKYE